MGQSGPGSNGNEEGTPHSPLQIEEKIIKIDIILSRHYNNNNNNNDNNNNWCSWYQDR